MKTLIDSKWYDTETSELIYDYWNGRDFADYNFEIEQLYQSNSGEYFLYCYGGRKSKYYNCRIISPMSMEEAQIWILKKGMRN